MFQRLKREIPELNTTSTADISFMLLIFFLVTSSMDADKGLARQLPPAENEQEVQQLVVKERNVLEVRIDSADHLTIGGEPATESQLQKRVKEFVANVRDLPTLPEKSVRELPLLGRRRVSDRHIIHIQVDSHTSYDAYFGMQQAIAEGYRALRNELAHQCFGHSYSSCSQEERDDIALFYPQRISEEPPAKKGGEE